MMFIIRFFNEPERWLPIDYKDIRKNMYEISNRGRVRNVKFNRIVNPCDPKHNQGYHAVPLLIGENRTKKFRAHRLVMVHFDPRPDMESLEVNHKNNVRIYNEIENLEWVTRKGNAQHAVSIGAYQTCDKHYKARLSSEIVHKICQLFAAGKSITSIIDMLSLQGNRQLNIGLLNGIKNRRSWCDISKHYKWDNDDIYYKTYKLGDIEHIAYLINSGVRKKEIVRMFLDKYDREKISNVIYSMSSDKLYKNAMKRYRIKFTCR